MLIWIFSFITAVFSVTWSFRNHLNMPICCSRTIYYYYQCWKLLCCLIFLWYTTTKNFRVWFMLYVRQTDRNHWTFYSLNNPEKKTVSTKILSSNKFSIIIRFSIDNSAPVTTVLVKSEQQISILEWFLKDHVTLRTGVLMLKIQLCITGIN